MALLSIPLTDNWLQGSPYTKTNTLALTKQPSFNGGGQVKGVTRLLKPSIPSGAVLKKAELVYYLAVSPNSDSFLDIGQINGGDMPENGYFTGITTAPGGSQTRIMVGTPTGEYRMDVTGTLLNSFAYLGYLYNISYRNEPQFASTLHATIKPKTLELTYDYTPNKPTNLSPSGGETVYGVSDISWTAPVGDAPIAELKYEVQYSSNDGQSWVGLGTTDLGVTTYSQDFSALAESNLARIRVRAIHGTTAGNWTVSAGVFANKRDVAPLAPTNLTPASVIIDRTLTTRFSWRHNDPNPNDEQSKAELQWRVQGGALWNQPVTVLGTSNELYIAPNTLPAGQIEWRVRTYDQAGLVSPYSDLAVITAADPSNAPVIISPASIVTESRPVVQWISGAQAAYQILIESDGVTVWDTGVVLSSNKAQTIGIDLVNGATYKVKVRIRDSGGLYSSFADKTVTVNYTPPAKPIVDIFQATGGVRLAITKIPPSGEQPHVVRMVLYKEVDGKFIPFDDISSVYTDYTTASEDEVSYYIRAYGSTGAVVNSDVVTIKAPKLRGVWLHDVNDPDVTIKQYLYVDRGSKNDSYRREHAYRQYAGRLKPVVEYGAFEEYGLKLTVQLVRDSLGRERLIEFVKSGAVLLYRDGDGRKFYTTLPQVDMNQLFYGHVVDLRLTEIDYREGV